MSSSTIQVTDSSDLSGQSTSRLVLQMARRDIATLFRTPWIIISRSLAFIIQLFVFAYLISGLVVKFPGFFPYYAVGSVVSVVASISFIIGYDIFEEAEEGLLDYLLTLPIPRREFIIGRALGGAVRAMIYTIPMFAIVAVLENFSNPLSLIAAIPHSRHPRSVPSRIRRHRTLHNRSGQCPQREQVRRCARFAGVSRIQSKYCPLSSGFHAKLRRRPRAVFSCHVRRG